jgi:hypothetical protein
MDDRGLEQRSIAKGGSAHEFPASSRAGGCASRRVAALTLAPLALLR